MRGQGEGCLATELEAIMGPCETWGGPHNAKQSVTGRLCQYYIMYTKLYRVCQKKLTKVVGYIITSLVLVVS